jgi:hypothetical protein
MVKHDIKKIKAKLAAKKAGDKKPAKVAKAK